MSLSRRAWILIALGLPAGLLLACLGSAIALPCLTSEPTPQSCDWVGLTGNSPASRLGRIAREEMSGALSDRRVVERAGKDLLYPESVGKELATRGYARLTLHQLDRWNRIRLRLVERSPRLCATLGLGRSDGALFEATLGELPEAEARTWMWLRGRALVAEVHATEPIAADESAFGEGIKAIADQLPRAEGERLLRIVQQLRRAAAQDEDACLAVRTTFRGAQNLEPRLRERFLRQLAHQGSKR